MTKTTTFVWNTVDDCVISELDGDNNVQAVYTNEPQQYGGVLSQRRGTTTSTYHADALGTTRALTDDSGTVTDTYVFDAWGNEVASTGSTVNPFRWVGRYGYYQDSSTALVYVRARMYQPTVARWASVDPLWQIIGQGWFLYSNNSPANSVDPTGTFCAPPDTHTCEFILEIYLHNLINQFERFAEYIDVDGTKRTCPLPRVKCCPNRGFDLLAHDSDPCKNCGQLAGSTSPPSQPHGQVDIGICPSLNVPGSTVDLDHYVGVLTHEMTHALSWCQKGWTVTNQPSCRELMCEEMIARVRGGQCPDGRYQNMPKCLQARVVNALLGKKGPCGGVLKLQMEAWAKQLSTSAYCTTASIKWRNRPFGDPTPNL